jgi:uncharacterized protein (DUF1810 family)
MGPQDTANFIQCLESCGLRFLDDEHNAIDIVVVDMLGGPTTRCDWITFDSAKDGPRCWLRGTNPGRLSKPYHEDDMDQNKTPKQKTFSFGGCEFGATSPNIAELSPDTPMFNIAVPFEEALKLHLAIGECIRKLNSYKRSTKAGKRSALNIAIHLAKQRITINETNRQPKTPAKVPQTHEPAAASDPHNLNRFVEAQAGDPKQGLGDYAQALREIRSGRKKSHWIWYIFPTFAGLWTSKRSKRYSIKSIAEAKAYLAHPVLGPRLGECAEAMLGVEGRSAFEIFGSPDDRKVRSCATLFEFVSPQGSVFERLISKCYGGERGGKTLRQLEMASEAK